jgi:hypothetical protein
MRLSIATEPSGRLAVRRAAMLQARERTEARARLAIIVLIVAAFAAMMTFGWYAQTAVEGRHRPQPRIAPLTAEQRSGHIVHELPDGISCRYVPFDNFTAWFGYGTTARCKPELKQQPRRSIERFSWGSK